MLIVKRAAPGVSARALARFTQRARKAAGLEGDVNVVLTSSRDLRALNRRFRGKDAPTDVLSFPPVPVVAPPLSRPVLGRQGGDSSAQPRRRRPASHQPPATSHLFSGDIVISTEIAARNARLYGHHAAQEIKILILHGMLHLAGYDHESDRGRMARQEERLRCQLGLATGLIGRAGRTRLPRGQRPTTDGRRPTTNDRRRRPR